MSAVTTREDLGDLCHFKNGGVPVAVLTDLKANIIASNDISTLPDEKIGSAAIKKLWFVSGVRIMITRFWASSTGYVMLSTDASTADIAPFPLDKLGIEREVCVWLGTLPYLRPVIPEDLGTHLLRCYVGVVDIVQATASGPGGYTIALQLRDRMKWLMDTVVSYNPALDEGLGEQPLRSSLILEVAQRGIGQVDGDKGCSSCGKKIVHNPDFYYDLGDFEKFGIERSGPLASANSPAAGRLENQGGTGQATTGLKSGLLSRFSPIIAAAFYGNLMQESGGRTNTGTENYLGAIGLVQWLYDRKAALYAFASARGASVYDLDVQLDFIVHELNGTESAANSSINSAAATGNLEQTTVVIRRRYERPGEAKANDAARIAYAKQFYSEINLGSTPAAAAPTATATAPSTAQVIRDAIPNLPTLEPSEPVNAEEVIATSEVPPANAWYVGDGTTPGPLAGSTTTTNFEVAEFPDFRIYTTRSPINLQQNPNFIINQQDPISILKFLAGQEVYMTEVFQDHRDGHLYYCPRANDSTGLDDPKRYHRTYFFRNYPDSYKVSDTSIDSCPPDHNQMMLSFREEQASLDLKTNFIVSKTSANSEGGSGDDWTVHLKVKPNAIKDVKYACKFWKIYDETITSVEEAAVVAMNAARIMGKEVRAATAIIIGDPSIVPGEVFQVFGSPLQPNLGIDTGYTDRATYKEFESAHADNIKVYAEVSLKNAGVIGRGVTKGQEVTLPVYDGSEATVKVEEFNQESLDTLICEDSSYIRGKDGAEIKDDPKTIFRVEAVIHKWNIGQQGYTTELALGNPF